MTAQHRHSTAGFGPVPPTGGSQVHRWLVRNRGPAGGGTARWGLPRILCPMPLTEDPSWHDPARTGHAADDTGSGESSGHGAEHPGRTLTGHQLAEAARQWFPREGRRCCASQDRDALDGVEQEFVRFCLGVRGRRESVAVVWQEFVVAHPQIRLSNLRCSECHGRRFSPRSLGRGSAVCLRCSGRGRESGIVVRLIDLDAVHRR
jgi:hypothetical protein